MPSGKPAGDRVIWDDTTEKHLLLCILASSNPTVNWNDVVTRFGGTLTASAAGQKYAKIKNRDKAIFEAGEGRGASVPGTPASGKKAASVKSTSAKKRGADGRAKSKEVFQDSEEDEDGDEDEVVKDEFRDTPSKKMKSEPVEETEDENQYPKTPRFDF